jgi:hypothetical protein
MPVTIPYFIGDFSSFLLFLWEIGGALLLHYRRGKTFTTGNATLGKTKGKHITRSYSRKAMDKLSMLSLICTSKPIGEQLQFSKIMRLRSFHRFQAVIRANEV